jgi:hypothetical protein
MEFDDNERDILRACKVGEAALEVVVVTIPGRIGWEIDRVLVGLV